MKSNLLKLYNFLTDLTVAGYLIMTVGAYFFFTAYLSFEFLLACFMMSIGLALIATDHFFGHREELKQLRRDNKRYQDFFKTWLGRGDVK